MNIRYKKSFSVTITSLNYNRERNLKNTLLAKKDPDPLQWRWSDSFGST
jgi:hypothetical protein